jgi:hypothetical protein
MPSRPSLRRHVFLGITRSLCPQCGRVIDAQVLLRDGAVYLRKRCPEHGWHEALISSDAEAYRDAFRYNKPGALPRDFATDVDRGCPRDCGLCPEHQQHTCVGIVEVTARCDLTCPVCFAGAGEGRVPDLTLDQIAAMLDRFVATEGRPEVVQLSGGEPTLHPQILEILAAAQARDIRHVMLNTNGLRLARDPAFVRALAAHDPTVYLQFDGVTAGPHRALRGRDLRAIKRQALDRLAAQGMYAILVVTLVRGVNDHEIGEILRWGVAHPAVLGVVYQPVTLTGRHPPLSQDGRLTLPDVLAALEAQTDGAFARDDFRPVPCPHPACTTCTYAYVEDGQVTPLTRLIDVDAYLDFVTNRAVPDLAAELQPVFEALWSSAAVMGSEATTEDLCCVACDAALPMPTEGLKEHFFMVQAHGFMDPHTFDVARLMKCCIHELLPDGRAIPFCAYNNLGYRARAQAAR